MTHAVDHAPSPPPPSLAKPEERVEGRLKVTGQARFAADAVTPGTLHVRFLESPVPHARLLSVDADAARAMPGVHAVLTGADVPGARMGRRLMDWPVFAVDRLRYVGDRIAAVAAETPEAAEAALARIDVRYEELPALLDPERATDPDAPVLHPEAAGYTYLGGERPPVPHANVQGRRVIRKADDDLDAVFAGAARVFEHTFRTSPHHAGYLEPHATVVHLDDAGVARIVSTNKAPFSLRTQIAEGLDIPAELVEIDAGFIGGDFGGKGVSIDEYACLLLARATGRPVRAVMTYVDELRTMSPRHAAVITLRTAVDADGRLLAHHARARFDGGAYAGAKPLPHLVLAGGSATLSAYRVPHVRIEVETVYTNHAPAGHVRSPGEVQALFAGESHMDMIARELGEDPLAFRLRNAIRDDDTGIAGERFREARAVEVLETLARETGWEGRERVPGRGWGLAMGVRHVGAGKASIRLRGTADGCVTIRTGLPDQGGGQTTVMRRVAEAVLGLPPDRIDVVRGTTSETPPDQGVGGSRVTHIASRAVEAAADELRAALAARAGDGAAIEGHDLILADGRRLGLAEALTAYAGDGIEVTGTFDGSAHGPDEPGDNDFAGYAIEVQVDPETGHVTPLQAVLVADVGTIINPVAHRGQLEGGFVFGLGAALMEELVREDGAVVNATLGEARIPAATDVPPLRIVLLPTEIGPGSFGAKMAGELSNAPVAPAVANAVADAVGARVTSLPITAEKVRAALANETR